MFISLASVSPELGAEITGFIYIVKCGIKDLNWSQDSPSLLPRMVP